MRGRRHAAGPALDEGVLTDEKEQLDLAGVTETIGRERFFPTVSAVEAFQAQEGTGSITRSG